MKTNPKVERLTSTNVHVTFEMGAKIGVDNWVDNY